MNCCNCNIKTIGIKDRILIRPYTFCSYVCMYELLTVDELNYLIDELYK